MSLKYIYLLNILYNILHTYMFILFVKQQNEDILFVARHVGKIEYAFEL